MVFVGRAGSMQKTHVAFLSNQSSQEQVVEVVTDVFLSRSQRLSDEWDFLYRIRRPRGDFSNKKSSLDWHEDLYKQRTNGWEIKKFFTSISPKHTFLEENLLLSTDTTQFVISIQRNLIEERATI